MNHYLHRISRFTAIFAFTAALCAPAYAGDPRLIVSSPVMLPGANQAVCDQLAQTAAFSTHTNTAVHVQTIQMPSSLNSCLSGLLGLSQQQNNAFLQPGNINISSIFTVALNKTISSTLSTLENKACSIAKGAANKLFNSVQNGLLAHVTFTNMMGGRFPIPTTTGASGGTGSGGTTGTGTTGTGTGSGSTPATPASSQIAAEESEPDDLDNVANSMGYTITANSTMPAGLSTASLYVDNNSATNPGVAPPPTYPMNSTSSPNNATICVAPNPRNDIPRDTAALDGDSPLLNPANYAPGSPVDNGADDAFLEGSSAPSTGNPVVPQSNTPSANGTPITDPAPNPASTAAANGTAGCASSNSQNSSNGINSTGTNCTANTKNASACMAGSGCSPQNNGIGATKDYQTGAIFAHGPYGSGSNLGQCAQLSQALVPNVGHTTSWRKGPAVFQNGTCNKTLQFGTVVATFFGPAQTPGATLGGQPAQTVYNYEPKTPNVFEQHTGIFVGCSANGMDFIEEYRGLQAPHKRIMEVGTAWDGTMASLTRNKNNEMHAAVNYYVVVH